MCERERVQVGEEDYSVCNLLILFPDSLALDIISSKQSYMSYYNYMYTEWR